MYFRLRQISNGAFESAASWGWITSTFTFRPSFSSLLEFRMRPSVLHPVEKHVTSSVSRVFLEAQKCVFLCFFSSPVLKAGSKIMYFTKNTKREWSLILQINDLKPGLYIIRNQVSVSNPSAPVHVHLPSQLGFEPRTLLGVSDRTNHSPTGPPCFHYYC